MPIPAASPRLLLGICSELRHPQRARRSGQPAYPSHDPGARRGAANDVCCPRRRQPSARLRRGFGATARPIARFRTRRRKLPSWRPRSGTPTFASRRRRMEFTSIAETATTSRRMRSRSFPSLALERMRRTPSISAHELMKAEIAWRLGKRYAQDEATRLGLCRRPPGRGPHAPARSGAYVARLELCELTPMPTDSRNHLDDGERGRTSAYHAASASSPTVTDGSSPRSGRRRRSTISAPCRLRWPTTPMTFASLPAA